MAKRQLNFLNQFAQNSRLWLLIASLSIFGITFFSINKDIGSDPKLTLLVAQSLLENGTIRLDAYQDDTLLGQPITAYLDDLMVIKTDAGHYYNYFPAGPSFISLPIVWIARILGHDMRQLGSNQIQYWPASITCVLVFLLIFRIGRYYLDDKASFAIALVSVMGSSLISTLGTAWWSHNPATLCTTTALWLLVRHAHGRPLNPYLLGLLLFFSFFARAASAPFIFVVLLYLFWQARRQFWATAVTAGFLLALFLMWSRLEFGQWLPAYYAVARIQVTRAPTWVGILGNLISPSRGILLFSPFFILTCIGSIYFWRNLRRQPLFWLCTAWFMLQLWLIARAASWWGGASFGPRLLTDALPALVLITILVWQIASAQLTAKQQKGAIVTFLGLGTLAIILHIGQGLYNRAAPAWNKAIAVHLAADEEGLGDLFQWQYTQLLASQNMLCRIEQNKMAGQFSSAYLGPFYFDEPLQFGGDQIIAVDGMASSIAESDPRPIAPGPLNKKARPYEYFLPFTAAKGNQALFIGWGNPENDFRWSSCPTASLVFLLGEESNSKGTYSLRLQTGAYGPQTVQVELNQVPLGTFSLSGDIVPPETVMLSIEGALLRPYTLNTLTFHFSNPQQPPPFWEDGRIQVDPRLLAISFRELKLQEKVP